eukprot:365315-Chlamydomonas_euryale.AAC.16
MILAVIVTAACWGWTEGIYPPRRSALTQRPHGSPPDALPLWVMGIIAAALTAAGVILIGGRA